MRVEAYCRTLATGMSTDTSAILSVVADFISSKIAAGLCIEPVSHCRIRYHDRPHFHLPRDRDAEGYLILGKVDRQHTTALCMPLFSNTF